MHGRRYLAFRYLHAGLMGMSAPGETPNNNLDTAVPRANR